MAELRQNPPGPSYGEFLLFRIQTYIALAALAGASVAFAAEPLTLAHIEKVTGLTGLVKKPAKYDKASQDYVTAQNDLAVTVKVASASVYEVWKSQPSLNDQTPLAGLGEDAILSKKGRYVCFRKAGAGICVTGMVALPGRPALVSDAQLLELAQLAASNL